MIFQSQSDITTMTFEDRKKIMESIKGVDLVVEDCMDFRSPTMFENLKKYKVDIAVHTSNWVPPLYKKAMKEGVCKVELVDYYDPISTTKILEDIRQRVLSEVNKDKTLKK